MVIEKAYAKVNLFLNVLDKREDGYHSLEMLNTKIDLFDILTFKIIDSEEAIIIKSNDLFLSNQENIVIQVARYMMKRYDIKSGLEITIEKNIPFGAGLAGNSADSAAVIKGMNKLFSLNLSLDKMMDIAVNFGADIPYCLVDKPAFVSGIGEKIEEVDLDLSNYKLLLINPKEFIGTKDVFEIGDKSGFKTYNIENIKHLLMNNQFDIFKKHLHNSLEEVVINNYPFMKEFKEILIEKLNSEGLVMTGSGSTFIKLTEKSTDLSQFIEEFKDRYFVKTYNFL
ncbi:MAG: 4-(cytidine 5'-diphospho)-2-C-methyl-D-erythritol kinase [Candidatus Izemoplasmatales bacterium]|jgi:4-diphosphocytidyl-2-C-methyl-D-erythritol kinase|nr:4-(cytidine 5'-diphospho)-2-C-methyl-D-erythritol kinase [Candidatus Izemoplasmatales bacterium]